MPLRSRAVTALLIAFLVLVWGVNWPLSKFALQYTPPLLFSGVRTLLGGLLVLAVAVPRYKKLQLRRTWPVYLLSALLNVVLYYGLQTVGLNYLPSGLFATLVFLQPVLVGVFSWLWLGESMNPLKLTGLLLGFCGVAVISGAGLLSRLSVTGIGLALGSALSWALGTVYVKRTGGTVDPIWLVSLQLIAGGLLMTAAGSATERWSEVVWTSGFVASLLFISVFVIALGWLVFYRLIGSGEAGRVASYTFLIPLVAIAVGMLFLHEPFSLSLLAGLTLIVLSIYCVNRKPRAAASAN